MRRPLKASRSAPSRQLFLLQPFTAALRRGGLALAVTFFSPCFGRTGEGEDARQKKRSPPVLATARTPAEAADVMLRPDAWGKPVYALQLPSRGQDPTLPAVEIGGPVFGAVADLLTVPVAFQGHELRHYSIIENGERPDKCCKRSRMQRSANTSMTVSAEAGYFQKPTDYGLPIVGVRGSIRNRLLGLV